MFRCFGKDVLLHLAIATALSGWCRNGNNWNPIPG